MFGFLKRLFGRATHRAQEQVVSPVQPAPAPIPQQTPPPPPPVVEAPPAPAPAPAPAPTLAFADDEDEGGFAMVQSLGNPDAYMIGLVGEEDHAEAVADLRAGMPIWLQLEPGNPHDSSAIAAVDSQARVIGYIAPDSWLREAIYGGGAAFAARVLATDLGERGFREVVLEVEPSEIPLGERRYQG